MLPIRLTPERPANRIKTSGGQADEQATMCGVVGRAELWPTNRSVIAIGPGR